MDMYGITAKQLKNAKKVIMQHYQNASTKAGRLHRSNSSAAAAREDELDKVVENLSDGLSKRLDDDDLDDIMNAFLGIMSSIGEPSVDAPTANIPISMVAGCVMYNLLCRLGLQSGNLSAVAKAVRRSGAGIKSASKNCRLATSREFPQGAELFADEVDEAADGDRSADEEPADE